jgi:hypothetical protein
MNAAKHLEYSRLLTRCTAVAFVIDTVKSDIFHAALCAAVALSVLHHNSVLNFFSTIFVISAVREYPSC